MKLQWYRHDNRSFGLAKAILQCMVEGTRKETRGKKWADNIKEWTGADFANTQVLTKIGSKMERADNPVDYEICIVSSLRTIDMNLIGVINLSGSQT